MKEFLPILKKSPLFEGLGEKEIDAMLSCLGAEKKSYEKDAFVYRTGEHVESVGLVLSGRIHVVREDFWGNSNLVAVIEPGQTFAESYACTGMPLAVSAVASEKTEVLFLRIYRVLTTCSNACEFHARLVRNLLSVLALHNLKMNEKLTHVTQRTLREKLLSYLSDESARAGGPRFDIPLNRQQLADYLSADRSALSSELGKMRDEGVITFEKNHFELL